MYSLQRKAALPFALALIAAFAAAGEPGPGVQEIRFEKG
jgi:hypothetical protein